VSDSRSRERCPKGSGITPGNKQFHTEGFVSTYVQQPSADDKTIVFVSEAIENIRTGYRARETYTIMSRHGFTERCSRQRTQSC
jgi:hypothetical protein